MSAAARAPASVRTAVVMSHSDSDGIVEAMRLAAELAERASCTLVAAPGERAKHDGEVAGVEYVDSLPERADLCLVLGGDGTILRALRHFSGTGVAVFGVNYGRIGFLATIDRDAIADGLTRAFAGDFEVMPLPGLQVGPAGAHALALNDASFTRRPHGAMAELAYRISGEEVGHVRCDGLVVATPAGSTGYNLANQGPILAWGVEGYVVSFVAPHTLTARALVVAPDDVLTVRNSGREPVDVALDGMPVGSLAAGDEIEVAFRDAIGSLAQLPGSSFYRRMREKFGQLAH